ncbi:unnamed protein product [Blepharisma stoltei]|uniref:RIIa domain-containing protein n=1 Tax=Blepharisma stoltei TaxID=1481888 RepID=A0AAU9K0G4_9CILI|nr:unnamed protein product [Blepharisma stoltei]
MASKYLQQFPIPPEFPNILRDLTREILRLQPQDIIKFAAEYFKCKQAGKEFIWDEANPRAPRPCDYPKIIRKEPEKIKYSTKPGSEPKIPSQVNPKIENQEQIEHKEKNTASKHPKSQEEKKNELGHHENKFDIQVNEKKSEFSETKTHKVITETRHEVHIQHTEVTHHESHHTVHETHNEGHQHIEIETKLQESAIPSLSSPAEVAAKEYVDGLVERVERKMSSQP